jgi:hypothetical protein
LPWFRTDYEDHANRDDAWVKQRKYEMDMAAAKKSMGGAKETFPIKLFAMLETVSQSQEKSIVSWLPHGRSFKVHDRRRFEDVILPTYFRYMSDV